MPENSQGDAERPNEPAPKASLQRVSQFARQVPLAPAIAIILLLAVLLACVWLWQISWLRPFLATAGAAVAAFAGPIPALLTPELRGKWLFAVVIAACTAAGVWFATEDLQDRLNRTAAENFDTSKRLDGTTAWVGDAVRQESPEQRATFLLAAGRSEKGFYRERRYTMILDSTRMILEIDPDNGHGLYYAGEAYRHFGDWDNMRDMFQKFLSAAAGSPDSLTGAAHDCYDRPDGFCKERLAYVNHLMALDSLGSAANASDGSKIDTLHSTFAFESEALAHWPGGFPADGRFLSSCDVLRHISQGLLASGASAASVDAFAKHQNCS
jgi:hypothetical protein